MAIKDKRQAKKARNIGIVWTIIAYIGALCLGWIGIALFGPTGLEDQEFVMPAVILKLFPPAIAAILITGAIAAMVSTADSLLILSATELTENIVNPSLKRNIEKHRLMRSRIVTALLAFIALGIAYISPTDLIFNLVSYVWAGIGGTFSVVILFTLFWKKYHGRAALLTIVGGLLFTVFWIGTGQESHYEITEETIQQYKSEMLVSEQILEKLEPIKNKRIVTDFSLKKELGEILTKEELDNNLSAIKGGAKHKGITSRILTFFVALLIAFLSTVLIPKKTVV